MKEYFVVGTYSEPILFGTGEFFQGKGKGVYLCVFDDETIRILDCLPLENPSFLTINERKKHIYAVNEMKEFRGKYGGGVSDIIYDDEGKLTLVSQFQTDGADPCHIAISPDEKIIGIANFADGKVSIFQTDEKGDILPDKIIFQHEGYSINPGRQKGPHAHSILFDEFGYMFVPDLGIDELKAYDISKGKPVMDEKRTIKIKGGRGPRTGKWTKNKEHFYLINELESSVTHMTYNKKGFTIHKTESTLPEEVNVENICADLHLTKDDKYLYASNRGYDSIAIFDILENGDLKLRKNVSCGGKTPRNFAINPSGEYLLVGNQDSDNITIFKIGKDGSLKMINKVDFPTPVCINFFKNTWFCE